MTTPKPCKPAPRKGSKATLTEKVIFLANRLLELKAAHDASIRAIDIDMDDILKRLHALENGTQPPVYNRIPEILRRLHDLETRSRYRDASKDEPVSNAGEAVGVHFRIVGEPRRGWLRRFLAYMGSP